MYRIKLYSFIINIITMNYFGWSFKSFRTITVLLALIFKINKLLIGIKGIYTL
jgi:hypothetical protein